MIILTTSASAQALSVIPREYVGEFTMSIRDDSTNVITYYDITSTTTSGDYLNFNNTFNPVLVENHFYDLRLYADYNFWNTNYLLWENDNLFWNVDRTTDVTFFRDKIFCTDQEIDQIEDQYYDLNKGQYTTYNGYDNTYLVI
tara:strand:+ start:24966 stop:25394 length:429 start_codon:yes stop_codon:yes gene_type:complete